MEMSRLPDDYSQRYESYRLLTFRNQWTKDGAVSAFEPAASAGFYYSEADDNVKCAFCSLHLHDWKSGDDPTKHHRRFRRNCLLVKGWSCGNISLKEEFLTLASRCDASSPTVAHYVNFIRLLNSSEVTLSKFSYSSCCCFFKYTQVTYLKLFYGVYHYLHVDI